MMRRLVRSHLNWHGCKTVKDRIRSIQHRAELVGHSMTWAEAREQYRELDADEIWVNDEYQVNLSEVPGQDGMPDMIHLSIKRLDKGPCRDWRDFQQIKNQLVGEECEAVELYPAEGRLVDLANQFHLWAITDPRFRFPFGMDAGERVVSGVSGGGSVQRPYDEEGAGGE